MAMLESQKRLVLGALVGFALLLHVLFCEWEWEASQKLQAGPIIVTLMNDGASRIVIYSEGENSQVAVFAGIVVPLGLLVLRVYLQLGWFGTVFMASRIKRRLTEEDIPDKRVADHPTAERGPTATDRN